MSVLPEILSEILRDFRQNKSYSFNACLKTGVVLYS